MRYFRSATGVAALAIVASLAACADPTAGPGPSPNGAPRLQRPIEDDPGGGGGGGGGGDDTGGGGTPGAQYRVSGQVYKIGGSVSGTTAYARVRGWSRFEKLVGSEWVKVDANHLRVACVALNASDQDDENNAGFTDVEFNIGPAYRGSNVTAYCQHQATFGGVTYTTTSTGIIPMT